MKSPPAASNPLDQPCPMPSPTSPPAAREQARTIIDELPLGCSYEEVLAALRLDHLIERGLKDVHTGATSSTKDLRRDMKSWWGEHA